MGQSDPGPPLRRLEPDDLGDHLDRLFRAAWAICGKREDAEDLVQDTYARVLARPRWLRSEDDLGYLLRALRNTHIARARSAQRRPAEAPLDDRVQEPAGTRGAWQPEQAIEVAALFTAIARLPSSFRDALVAVDVAGLSYGEAARALRVKEATITSRLYRARTRISNELTDGPTTVRSRR